MLATCTRIFAMHGLLGMFGHISVYLPESRRVVICPGSGADKARVQAADMLLIDLEGKLLEGTWTIPREWPIHTELHQARADARAVAHCHAHTSTLFAIAQHELRPVTMSGAIFADGVPVYQDVEFIDTVEAGRRVVAAIGDIAKGPRQFANIEEDDAPLLGLPDEVAARLRRLQAGGVETVLLVDPNASLAGLRAFAAEVMPAFR